MCQMDGACPGALPRTFYDPSSWKLHELADADGFRKLERKLAASSAPEKNAARS